MAFFGLFVEEPVGGGFNGPAAAYYLKLSCDTCGEPTTRDVCLVPGPDSCTNLPGIKNQWRYTCYPTCPDSGHVVVRKCKVCSALGSVALLPGHGKALTTSSRTMVMMLQSKGYTPTNFAPGSRWVATKVTGYRCELELTADHFKGYDGTITIPSTSTKFSVEKLKRAEVPTSLLGLLPGKRTA
ncbi:uncharacterized protein [Oryza sativa Japonica Group]|uniref:uncharacterized protein n=1 Tax=Oryza sativa subsp. japonica TaxID=39947 RepID=UPI000E1BB8B1|nr:uncharacterized protein LOC112939443 [Oryza sativa Japonica Group]KAF2928201.1 hypothetical protein DAI22_06g260900 [Oryza sativa Japonica Group]